MNPKRGKSSTSKADKQDWAALPIFPFQMNDVRLAKIDAEFCELEADDGAEPEMKIVLLSEDEVSFEEGFGLALLFEVHNMPAGDAGFNMTLTLEGYFEAVVDPETVDQEVFGRFVSSDAVLLFWPYLREAVHNITRRMGLELPPLPIVDARQLVSAPASAQEEISE